DNSEVAYDSDPRSTFVATTPTTGGSLVAGDLLIFQLALEAPDDDVEITSTPSDTHVLIPLVFPGSGGSVVGAVVYYHFVTSGELSATTWSFGLSEALDGSICCSRFRNV